MGYARSVLLRRALCTITHPHDVPLLQQYTKALFLQETHAFDISKRVIGKENRTVTVLAHGTLVSTRKGFQMLMYMKPLPEQKMAVDSSSGHPAYLEWGRPLIVGASAMYPLIKDGQTPLLLVRSTGSIVGVNNAACQLFGKDKGEFRGCSVMDITHPDDREATAVVFRHILRTTGGSAMSVTKRYIRFDGLHFWARATAIWTPASDYRWEAISAIEVLTGSGTVNGARLASRLPGVRLTTREYDVLQLLTKGRSTKEIAHELRISVRTAETHRKNLMKKFGAHTLMELFQKALAAGWIRQVL